MKGLSPEHHSYLNDVFDKTIEEQSRICARVRKLYSGNPLALEQIDGYDPKSPLSKHRDKYRKALKRGDEKAEKQEEEWFAENYPLTHSKK